MSKHNTSSRLPSAIAGLTVGLSLLIHSECGYTLSTPSSIVLEPPMEDRVVFYGWPVRHTFELIGDDGFLYQTSEGIAAYIVPGFSSSILWGLVDPSHIDAWKWNTTIWAAIVALTICCSGLPRLDTWQVQKFSFVHLLLLMLYLTMLMYLFSVEKAAWTHIPMAFGLTSVCLVILRLLVYLCLHPFKNTP